MVVPYNHTGSFYILFRTRADELRGPLVLIVLCFFVAGAFLGLMTMIPVVFRRQRELAKQRKRITELEQAQETHVKTNETSSASTVSGTKTE